MKTTDINPVYWRLDTLLSCGADTIHGLARVAAGTITSYRLVLGRCLLALQETGQYLDYGCSSATHYATAILGLSSNEAWAVKRVAKQLLTLPRLSHAAETGSIAWSKLREITSKASLETEEYWLELASNHNAKTIQFLVSRTPKGSLPGENDPENLTPKTELRCPLDPEVWKLLEHAKAALAASQGESLTTGEVLERALTCLLAQQPPSKEVLAKAREEARKDLAAERARQHPAVWEARELALEMGLLGPGTAEVVEDTLEETLTQAVGLPISEKSLPTWENIKAFSLRGGDQFWENERLRFNPKSRHATRAQRKELLRRDAYQCQTPGCPNRLWLHLHHILAFESNGKTLPWNLVCLCSSCHRNVHRGHLVVTRQGTGELVFTDSEGRRLDRKYDLEVAGWLDFHLGWSKNEWNSHSARLSDGTWSAIPTMGTG